MRSVPESIARRIQSRCVISDDGCWEWRGWTTGNGYGRIKWTDEDGVKVVMTTHTATYLALMGTIPRAMQLDHLCRNRGCCNPAHLEPVTPSENTRRSSITQSALNTLKTRCPQGHLYSALNTRFERSGKRHCRTCDRHHRRATDARKQQLAHAR